MTMRTASPTLSPCELIRKINDLAQGDNPHDLEVRKLCARMVSVLVFVESTFDVRIPDKEAIPDNFDTVTKITNLVIKHKK